MAKRVPGWTPDSQEALQKSFKRMKAYAGSGELEIGLLPNAQDYPQFESGQSLPTGYISKVVYVGTIHEYGLTANRKYVRWLTKAFKKDSKLYRKMMTKVLKVGKNNLVAKKAGLALFGKTSVNMVKDNMDKNKISLPANEPEVAERKGGNTPMIDTQHLTQQIDYKVYKVEQ